jgi:hypothetical protein
MRTFVIGLFVGIIVGGVLAFFIFVRAPQASQAPGNPVLPPDPNASKEGTARIVLPQEFFNGVLQTIFTEMKPPVFAVGQQSADCDGQITILPEGSGTRTAVSFEKNTITAPLAFAGSYASPVGCLRFTGWARSNFGLRYDPSTQTVYGQLNVENVSLDGVNPFVGAIVTPFVQSTLNTRVNPIRILDGKQVAVNLPVAAAQGNLNAAIRDVRAEVKDNALNIDVIYDFAGAPLSETAQPSP